MDFYVTGGTNGVLASFSNSQPFTNIYQAIWSNVPPGSYTITAVATNNSGLASTSAPVSISVIPVILVNGAYTNTHTFTFLATDSITVSMTNPVPNGTILYTTNGANPAESFLTYQGPFNVTDSMSIRALIVDQNGNYLPEVDPVSIQIVPLYGVGVSTLGGGTAVISPPNGPYLSNSTVTLTATASNGWQFLGWTGDVLTNANSFSLRVNTNKSIQAIFGTPLTILTNAGGSILAAPSNGPYPYGSTVRLTAVPNAGRYFSQWQRDATNFSADVSPLNFPIASANPTVGALFLSNSPNFFTLNVQVGTGDGTVTRVPFANQYTNLTSVNLTSAPAPGQLFVNWINNGVPGPSTSNLTVVMTNNKTVIANFSAPIPPYVAITSPTNGVSFGYQAPIAISANSTSAVGSVVQVAFYNTGALLGAVANAPFNFIWTNAPPGTNFLTAVASDNFALSSTSSPVSLTVVLPPPGPPVFSLSAGSYSVFETNGSLTLTVVKSFNSYAGTVNYATADGSALAVSSNGLGNYFSKSGSLSFATNETSRQVSILIKNNSNYFVGDRTFSFVLSLADSNNSSLGNPDAATITIVEADPQPPRSSYTTNIFPSVLPPHTGQLAMYILPEDAGGQWRLVREKFWRNSGDIVGRLATGSYEVEFKPVPGFLPPENITVPVSDGMLTPWTNQYPISLVTTPTGPLTVRLQPPGVANALDVNYRAQWRLLGQSNWLDSGVTLNNLLATRYAIECKTIPNYATPALTNATVAPNPNNELELVYNPAPPPPDCLPPSPVPYTLATNATPSRPYLYTGQLLSEAGFGSGCVVKKRVVLTAAHVVFNDAIPGFVPTVKWFFQRYAGQYEPPTQTPRGWYVLDGYSTARTNDSPGTSSLTSQHLDAAALYFYEDAGRGGQSGYLVSDPDDPDWLQSQALMTLVGYPVEEVSESIRGQVFRTPIDSYSFTRSTNAVFNTADVCGLPGMSGGPLFVLNSANNTFYAAAIYLGQSDETIVRTIDAEVADIINRADATAHTGNNNTGGGVLLVSSTAGATKTKALLTVNIGPQAAIDAGGGWELVAGSTQITAGRMTASSSPTYFPLPSYFPPPLDGYFPPGGAVTVLFDNAPGWDLLESTNLTLILGQTVIVSALYTPQPPLLHFTPEGIGLTGTTNTKYRLERSSPLGTGSWLPVRTNTLTNGFNLFLPRPSVFTNGPASFYRAVWLP